MQYLTFCIIFQLLHVRAFKVEPRQDKDTSSSPAGRGSLKKSRHTDTRTRTDFLAQGEFWIYEMTWRSPIPPDSSDIASAFRFRFSLPDDKGSVPPLSLLRFVSSWLAAHFEKSIFNLTNNGVFIIYDAGRASVIASANRFTLQFLCAHCQLNMPLITQIRIVEYGRSFCNIC